MHSQYSPSAAHRWLKCPGSLSLEAALPPPKENTAFQDEGTAAHEVGAAALMANAKTDAYAGTSVVLREGTTWPVSEEMAEQVAKYVELVRSFKGNLLVEQKLDYSDVVGVPDSYGTGDAVVIGFDGRLTIIDLKYGMGVRVSAVDNDQLSIYAIAALDQYAALGPFTEVEMVICQPRLDHVSRHLVSVDDLHAYAAKVTTVIQRLNIGALNDVLVPGESQCRWCRAKATCPALRATAQALVRQDFSDLTVTPADDLGAAMDMLPLMDMWSKAVTAEANRRLLSGAEVTGYKLVEGRQGNREWTDPVAVADALAQTKVPTDQVLTTALNSPAKIEKALKKYAPAAMDRIMGLTTRSPGRPTVAPATDRRPAVVLTSDASAFADLIETETAE